MRTNIASIGHWQRHEDLLSEGVPDVSYTIKGASGWVELKYLPKTPPEQHTATIRHFTKEQRNWLVDCGRNGGRAWLLLQLGKSYYLYNWRQVHLFNVAAWQDVLPLATGAWHGRCNWGELVGLLVGPY